MSEASPRPWREDGAGDIVDADSRPVIRPRDHWFVAPGTAQLVLRAVNNFDWLLAIADAHADLVDIRAQGELNEERRLYYHREAANIRKTVAEARGKP